MGENTLDASVTDAMKASQEAQEMATASLQRLSSQYGMDNISGTDAAKVLRQYDDRHKEAMKLIRKNYGDDIRGFDKFMLAYGAKMEDERRSLAKMCGAEMRHGLGVAVKTDTEKRFADIEHRDMLDGASITAGQAIANEEASEAFHSRLDEIDSEAEEAKNRARQDYERAIAQEGADRAILEEEYNAKIAAIDSATSISRGVTAGESVDALKKIKGMESSNATSKAKPLRDDFRNIFIQRLKAEGADCLGHSPEIAMANALQATRNGVIGYFTNRIKSGQVAAVLATLDELEKLGDEDFKASKVKSPTGVYDPSAYGFLRKSDITALKKAAIAQVEERRTLRNRHLIESQRSVKLEEQALLDDITRHSIGVADDGETPLYKTEEDRMRAQKLLYDRAKELEKRAGAAGYSVRKVFMALANEPRKYLAMKERSERIAKKALGQQYVREQERMVEEELDRMLKAATTGGEVEIDVPVRDEQSGKDGTVKMRVDVHRAIVDAIDCARANGLCKGEYFTRVRNEHLNNKRYMEIIENAANEFFDFGTEGTVLVDGKWGDRAKGSTTRIFLSEGEGGSFKADNVRSNMRVKVHLKGRKADTDESFFDTTDRYVNADTLNQIIRAGKEYLDSKLNPTAEDFRQVFGNAIREAIDKENIQSFQGDTLDTVRRHFNQVFQDHEETFGVWRNGPSTTFFGAPVGAWNQGGQTQRITVAGERRWQDVRQIIPLAQKLHNEKLKNAIIDAQYDESQGRDVDEQIRDLLDGGDTDE